MRPHDLPPPSRWASRPHGTRLRYISGCRCVPCRAANSRYETTRLRKRQQGDWNGLVDARYAVARVNALRRRGMGYKQIARLARMSRTTMQKVLNGTRLHLRARTAKRIFDVPFTLADGQFVPAAATWQLLQKLIDEGYPKVRLARWLGQACVTGLQVSRRRVRVSTARRVRQLYRRLTAESREAAS